MPSRVSEPQHTICPVCDHIVVQAETPSGRPIALDTGARAYYLRLQADTVHYRAEQSAAYPVHLCRGKEA